MAGLLASLLEGEMADLVIHYYIYHLVFLLWWSCLFSFVSMYLCNYCCFKCLLHVLVMDSSLCRIEPLNFRTD